MESVWLIWRFWPGSGLGQSGLPEGGGEGRREGRAEHRHSGEAVDGEGGRDVEQAAGRGAGGFEIAEVGVAGDEVGVGHAEGGIGPDRQVGVGDGLGEAAGEEAGERQRAVGVVVERVVERAEAQRPLGMGDGAGVALAVGGDERAEAEGEGGVGVHRQGAVEDLDGGVVVAGQDGAHEGGDAHGLGVVGVDRQRRGGMGERGGAVGRVEAAAEVALFAAPGGVAVRRQEVRIERQGALEQAQGGVVLGGGVGDDVGKRPQVEVVGVEVLGALAAGALDLGAEDLGLDHADDLLGQLVLQVEDVAGGALEAAGPDVAAGGAVDEVRVDAQARAGALGAAFEQVADAELGGDAAGVEGLAAIGEGGVAGDDEEAGDAGEAGDQVLDQAVGEVVRAGVRGEGGEGEDGDRGAVGAGGWRLLGEGEAVAAAGDGLQDGVGVVAERAADFVDALDEAVVGDGRVLPDRLHQLGLGDQPVGVADQVAQRGEGLRAQDDRRAVGVTQGFVGQIGGEAVHENGGRQRDVHPGLRKPGGISRVPRS